MLYALECAFGKNIPKDFACAFELSKWVAEFGKGKYMINGRSYAGLAADLIVQMHEPATGMDLIVKTKENEALSRHYSEISVSEDDALGDQYQALFYEAGVQGFPMDKKRAVYWYEKALNHKYLDEDQNSRYLLVNSLNRARSN